jgi:hypothetical protein
MTTDVPITAVFGVNVVLFGLAVKKQNFLLLVKTGKYIYSYYFFVNIVSKNTCTQGIFTNCMGGSYWKYIFLWSQSEVASSIVRGHDESRKFYNIHFTFTTAETI